MLKMPMPHRYNSCLGQCNWSITDVLSVLDHDYQNKFLFLFTNVICSRIVYNLQEVRYFLRELKLDDDDAFIISNETWEYGKRQLIEKYELSSKIEICLHLIRDFEATNTKRKYKSDFEVFIRESKLHDFLSATGETIFVSTIHKAKGKEFDNVFLLEKSIRGTSVRFFNPDARNEPSEGVNTS